MTDVPEYSLDKILSQFQILFDLSPDAIMLLGDNSFKDCNPATLRIFGCTKRSEFIGKHPSQFSPVTQPNGIDSATLANQMIARALKTGSNRFEWDHARLDGSIFTADVLLVAFEREGKRVLQATVRDITAKKSEELALEMALSGIVSTMSKIMELRDPYTAGHQSRVAEIACLIAKEMGWGAERIKGLRMAGLVHDIGKIAIPAEILVKPSKLSKFEEMLMEEHPGHGYELLKDIQFPWPIADFVRQHHERIDGSGYPLGLKGENISPEAKILGVADTIEAMSTHRPYRPALGLPVALAEITSEAGIKFDVEVVNAAIKLFFGKEKLDEIIH
jgi:PAS domain S-box-containing protein/putative nucleotidyltransferase with HDIG domain